MSTAPSLSALRSSKHSGGGGGSSADPAWTSALSGNSSVPGQGSSPAGSTKPFVHAVPPSDPLRQANRLPIKVLKMLTARTGHILHPEYLQPLPSTPVSPIELDAKKSPLALLAQTCSQIGKPDPSPSSKLSSVASNGGGAGGAGSGTGGDKDAKSGPLKLSDIGVEDKSSFKPYSKPGSDKEGKSGFRVPSATCQPFTPRTGSPSSSASACSPGGMLPSAGGGPEGKDDKKDPDVGGGGGNSKGSGGTSAEGGPAGLAHGRISCGGGINVDVNQHPDGGPGGKALGSDCGGSSGSSSGSGPSAPASSSVLGSGLVAPVSPYKPGQTVFPLPPAGMTYPGSLAGAYAGYPPQFLPHGVALDPTKPGSLVGAQLAAAAAGSLGCSKPAGSSPLAGASPPSVMTASLCRDPYCLSYHCASHLAGAAAASASCAHDPAAAAAALKSGYPLVYPTHPLHGVHSSLTAAAAAGATPPSLAGHPLYPYGFMLPNDPLPHICNWVSANGPCDKRFATSEELLSHLRTHTAFPGTDKLLSGYPSSSSLASAAAAAMACHMHIPTSGAPGSPGTLALRSPHHALGLSSRYHPYSKSPLPTPGAPVPVPAATGPYYSPYALYGQRLTTASALGYQ
uniref:Zinc finger protein 503 n=1 Tax=Ailuropoda melanoleuca TaxID=9646 RepID=G1L4D4_AILME